MKVLELELRERRGLCFILEMILYKRVTLECRVMIGGRVMLEERWD